jgi:hypothetical protein
LNNEVDEVKEIHDKARALEHYERLAKNEAEDRCYQIRWRAANRAGELLKAMDKEKGGRSPNNRSPAATDFGKLTRSA